MSRAAAEATARVGPRRSVPAVLRSLGADPVQVFADARVDPALFYDADSMISFAARGRLLRQSVAATGCAHFGLLVWWTHDGSGLILARPLHGTHR
jgi:hypothetical protein